MSATSFDFDEIIERRSTHALKWVKYEADKLPLWVADSDFKCPQPILDAIQQHTAHGVMGYHNPDFNPDLAEAVASWLARKHQWHIDPDWLVWLPGIVCGFNVACRAFCQPGDKVLVQTPNYGPLLKAGQLNQLETVTVGTLLENNRWGLDFAELEKKAADPACKVFLFCNPMNPCGSVFTAAELAEIERICLEHNVVLCSDEIHCDLILDQTARHVPAGTLTDIGECAITLMAPSKTFNIAGLGSSFAVIRDAKIREQFFNATQGILPWINALAQPATIAAFTKCDDWLDAQLDYLRANRQYLNEQLNQLNGLRYHPAQATYLAWVDASGLGVDDVHQYMLGKGIAPSPGAEFGAPQFTRLNFACPRAYLEQAVERLKG